MAENSKIEWCHHTFNPWIGCTVVGPGCANCYARDLSQARLGVMWGPGQPRRHTAASTWNQPRAWNRKAEKLGIRYRVFCASLADVFDNEVPAEWRAELFQLIRETPHLDWLLVTKRIGNASKMAAAAGGWPENVWLGATIVNQEEADRDVVKLLMINGPRYRFLSMEPLLGEVRLREISTWVVRGAERLDALTGALADIFGVETGQRVHALDWIIIGGESGHGARPIYKPWVQAIEGDCREAGVAFLFKQWGEWFPYGEIDAEGHGNTRSMGEHPRKWHEWPNGGGFSVRLGKKLAGRLLDGVQHDGYPV